MCGDQSDGRGTSTHWKSSPTSIMDASDEGSVDVLSRDAHKGLLGHRYTRRAPAAQPAAPAAARALQGTAPHRALETLPPSHPRGARLGAADHVKLPDKVRHIDCMHCGWGRSVSKAATMREVCVHLGTALCILPADLVIGV